MAKDNQSITFAEALAHAKTRETAINLLLGNGFSISYSQKFFYSSLFDEANFSAVSTSKDRLREIFGTNFEDIVRGLQNGAKICALYGENDLLARATEDAEQVKQALGNVLTKIHPLKPDAIRHEQYRACCSFLHHFQDIYTLNYDVLLYWAVMDGSASVAYQDGFRKIDGQLIWSEENAKSQRLHYLHGALHLAEVSAGTLKLSSSGGDTPLLNQIKSGLESDRFPLLVSEGTFDQKLERVRSSRYLNFCYESLKFQSGCLFILGHSLADVDKHILDAIADSDFEHIYVGIHGDQANVNAMNIRKAAFGIVATRKAKYFNSSLDVTFFQSETAKVWG